MEQEMEQSIVKLKVGETYKIYSISGIASTVTNIIKIVGFCLEKGKYIFSEPRKRKKYYLTIDSSTMILPLNDKVLTADSETSSFCGNALINLMGKPNDIRKVIDEYNLNPELDKSIIVACERTAGNYPENTKETPVYLEEAKKSRENHAVMDSIIEKIEALEVA